MEEQPTSTGAEQPAAPIPPTTPSADTGDTHARPINAGDIDTCDTERMPRTHEEWTAFAALPPTQRADVYIRALRSMTAVVATLAVAGPVAAVAILAMPGIRGLAHDRRLPAVAPLGR